jgi:hypothetical protein
MYMDATQGYQIGTPGVKWSNTEKSQWRAQQEIKRSYKEQVLDVLDGLGEEFELIQYGALSCAPDDYPLFIIKSKNWKNDCENVFVTGGVHGYETSGVHGALCFALTEAKNYLSKFNFVIAPCISPWGYETINRWNSNAVDPNRSFYRDSPSEEASALMSYISALATEFITHIDLHETTDTDNSEFRPALGARDAIEQKNWNIPDGFYLVGDSTKPVDLFQKAIINKVKTVTHIAPADEEQRLIGEPLAQFGVINYAARELGLCMGLTDAPYVTTTEVYPDSPLVNDKNCINAQVAVITAALDYLSQLPASKLA